jgi:Tfp pilus assembly protein PilF
MRIHWNGGLAALAAIALSLLSVGCHSAQEKYADHMQRGAGYERDGKRPEAMIEYRNALQLEPTSADANLSIARLLLLQDKSADALFYFREAQRLDPQGSAGALGEAKLILFQDTARADELVRGALERDPANPAAHLQAAEIALARGDSKTALASVMTAIQLDPKDGLYEHNLGLVQQARIRELRGSGQEVPPQLFEDALKAFRKADELYGGNLNSRLMLVRTYASWPGHEKESEAALRDALAFAKEKGSADDKRSTALGILEYANLRQDAALRAWGLEELVATDPSALDAWAELAATADAQGQSGEAVYARLLAARPEDARAVAFYASYLVGKGKPDQAIAALDAAIEKGKDRPLALDEKTRVLLQLKRPEEAHGAVDRLRKEFPSDARTALATARVALYEQRPADAVAELRRAISAGDLAEAQYLLSVAEGSRGNLEPATAAIDRAIALTPGFSAILLRQKATLQAASKDWPALLQTLQRLEAGMGTLPADLRPTLAQALYESQNDEGGRKVLERMMEEPATLPIAAVLFAQREGARDPQTAYKHLDAAAAAAPDQPPIIAALVQLDLASKKLDRAQERLDAALAKGKEVPALRLQRAQVLALKGDLAGAEADARKVLDEESTLPGTASLLVAIYTARGDLDAAASSLEAADQAGKLPPGGLELLGRIYLGKGDTARARASFEKALAGNQNLAEAKNGLAYLLASEGGDLDRALTLAQEAQRALPNSAEVTDTLGFVYLKKGLGDAAIDRFRYAIELTPSGTQTPPALWYHLGLALGASGKSKEAADAYEKALAASSGFPEADAARRELEKVRAASAVAPGPS